MANIGAFKKSGQEFQGEIVTLSLQTKGVRIVPETDRTNDNTPSHRVYVGRGIWRDLRVPVLDASRLHHRPEYSHRRRCVPRHVLRPNALSRSADCLTAS
jgi:Protein of unknown function (DUF736)